MGFSRKAFGVAALVALSGAARGTPSEAPDREFAANHCEFYVNSLGKVRLTDASGWTETYADSYISVNEWDLVANQKGRIRAVGMLANGRDVVLANKIEPAYYHVRLTLEREDASGTTQYDLERFAYFIDVVRHDGSIDRLWLTDGIQDFHWAFAFEERGKDCFHEGSVDKCYAREPSSIYHQRRACQK